MQVDLKRRADEIEKKTQEVDLLNRKYEKIVAGQQGGPETGQQTVTRPVVSMMLSVACLESIVRSCPCGRNVHSCEVAPPQEVHIH